MDPRIPLPFAKGWYCVAEEAELARGEVRRLHCFGEELVLWREEGGAVHVVDAYCPHLGAHLGVGGRVEGDRLRCPFHGWKFDGSGRCVEIAYAKRIPPKAALGNWPICVVNGLVFAWYDPDGDAPFYEIPEVPEFGAAGWTEPEKRSWEVRTHPQEMAENTVDSPHFHFVHGTPHIPEMKAEIRGAVFHGHQGLTFTTPAGEKPGSVDITCHGVGFGVTRFQGVVETLLMITGIPIDAGLHRTTIRYTVREIAGNPEATRGVAKAFVAELARQYSQDIPIWEHKRYLAKPLLCDGDGPIPLVRRYYAQFVPRSARGAAADAGG